MKSAPPLLFLSFVALLSASVAAQNGYTSDASDWWSITRTDDDSNVPVQSREPSPSHFQILGLKLDDDIFSKAAAKLGKAPVVERGDASTGRSQVCYISPEERGTVHLVFEKGEVNEAFYLFVGGPDWKGSELCLKSKLITENLRAASGLGLGQSPAEVQTLLGKPSKATKDKLIYSYSVEKKSSAEDLRRMRQQYPAMSDEELRKNYEFYSLGVYIEARFSNSKLIYLAVSKTEAY